MGEADWLVGGRGKKDTVTRFGRESGMKEIEEEGGEGENRRRGRVEHELREDAGRREKSENGSKM